MPTNKFIMKLSLSFLISMFSNSSWAEEALSQMFNDYLYSPLTVEQIETRSDELAKKVFAEMGPDLQERIDKLKVLALNAKQSTNFGPQQVIRIDELESQLQAQVQHMKTVRLYRDIKTGLIVLAAISLASGTAPFQNMLRRLSLLSETDSSLSFPIFDLKRSVKNFIHWTPIAGGGFLLRYQGHRYATEDYALERIISYAADTMLADSSNINSINSLPFREYRERGVVSQ